MSQHQAVRLPTIDDGPGRAGGTAIPLWFGPDDRPLAGWLHVPPGKMARGSAVLCAPFGREYLQAHYALRLVAEGLAARGITAVRFDYDGMGDSAGDHDDPDRAAAWLRSTTAAIDLARATSPGAVSLVGIRMGATLATLAAAEDGRVDQLVLWDPCLSGRAFLREQQAVSALTFGGSTTLPDGSVDTPGMTYPPHAVADLRGLRLDRVTVPVARRVLVMTRSDRDIDESIVAPLASVVIDRAEAVGQQALMDVGPPFQQLPHDAIDRVVDWVSHGVGPGVTPVCVPPLPDRAVVGRDSSGRPIVERPCSIGLAGLFGIVTEPEEEVAGRPVALFLSVANEHHIGPNRLWVQMARRWAGEGFRCVRLDFSGLGDSPVRSIGQERFVARAPESFDDVEDAVRAVGGDDPSRVVLVGLCASAYQAIDSALAIRPGAVVAMNPVLSFVPAEVERGDPLDIRRRAALPRTAVVGAFHDGGRLSALRRRFPDVGWWLRLRAHPRRRPATWLRDLVQGGTDVLLVAGEREWRPIRLGSSTRLRAKLARTGRFRSEYIPDLEHGLLTGVQRRQIVDLVTEHVVSWFRNSDHA